jgi:AAA domain-containing protein
MTSDRLRPVHWSKLDSLPAREPLIEGLFDIGAMSGIVGATGAYKTGQAIDFGGHIAIGRSWRGRRVRPGSVVYLAPEGGWGIAERLAAWRKYHHVELTDGAFYVVPEPIDLAHGEADARLLLQRIAELQPSLPLPLEFIGIDTTSRALAGGDENSPKDLGQFVRCCDIIRAETRAHLCTVHHLGKDESRGARGHSLLKAALDTEITAVKSGATGTIEVTKQRDHPDGQRFGFAIELVDLGDSKSSYVVIPSDAPPTLKACRWSRGLTVFRGAVEEALLAHGQEHHPAGNGQVVKAVAVEDARTAHSRLYAHGGEGDRSEAERKAWKRALQAARGTRLIGSESSYGRDLIWLTS